MYSLPGTGIISGLAIISPGFFQEDDLGQIIDINAAFLHPVPQIEERNKNIIVLAIYAPYQLFLVRLLISLFFQVVDLIIGWHFERITYKNIALIQHLVSLQAYFILHRYNSDFVNSGAARCLLLIIMAFRFWKQFRKKHPLSPNWADQRGQLNKFARAGRGLNYFEQSLVD